MARNKKKYKLIAIVGEAGSGKDSLARALAEELKDKAHEIISYTTRPPRDYEIDGIDYHFVDPGTLASLILEDKILEAAEFNNWVYATGIDDLDIDKINIAVLNPEGIESISSDSRIDMLIVRCMCPDKERLLRQLNREENPDVNEIVRRFTTDKKDFANFFISDYSNWTTIIPTMNIHISAEVAMVLRYVQFWTEEDN